jgi:hypothetical protein
MRPASQDADAEISEPPFDSAVAVSSDAHSQAETSVAEPRRPCDQVLPAAADRDAAIQTLRHLLWLDRALSSSDARDVLNELGWLSGEASGIVRPQLDRTADGELADSAYCESSRNTAAIADASPPTSVPNAAIRPFCDSAPNSTSSGSCAARQCTFLHHRYVDPGSFSSIVDGAISVSWASASVDLDAAAIPDAGPDAAVSDAGTPNAVAVDLTEDGCHNSLGPMHITAEWSLADGKLTGWWRSSLPAVDYLEHFVRFEAVVFSDDQPVSGRLYAKVSDDLYGTYETEVSFP